MIDFWKKFKRNEFTTKTAVCDADKNESPNESSKNLRYLFALARKIEEDETRFLYFVESISTKNWEEEAQDWWHPVIYKEQ